MNTEQTSESAFTYKKQLLIVLSFLVAPSFLVRKRLQNCIRNHSPHCSLRISFQSKTRFPSLFRFKYVILKEKSFHLVYKFTFSCQKDTSCRASGQLSMTPLTGKQLKNPKKLAIFDQIFLKGHDSNLKTLRFSLKKTTDLN